MASFNRVILVGNLTKVPELRTTPTGLSVTDIDLAVNDRRKSATGEWIDETTYVNNITLWGRQAEVICEYTSKGSSVLVEGRLKLDSWESEGQRRTKLKVIGDRIQLLGSRGGSGSGGGGDDEGGGYASRQGTPRNASRSGHPPVQQQHDYYDTQDGGDEVPF